MSRALKIFVGAAAAFLAILLLLGLAGALKGKHADSNQQIKQVVAKQSENTNQQGSEVDEPPLISIQESGSISSVSGWVCVLSFILALYIEPKEPKRDGRFKTGYKNNARVRQKSKTEVHTQIVAVIVGILSALLWYYLK